MSHRSFGRAALRTLAGLDLGLRVRLTVHRSQRTIFQGAEDLSVQALISELAELASSLRVYGYAMRGQLETLTTALQLNAECGSWGYARRAALDLSSLFAHAARRRLANVSLCSRASHCALRIAELCAREVR